VEYRSTSAYVDEGDRNTSGRSFFQRWYDNGAIDDLVAAVPVVEVVERETVRLSPNLNSAYARTFPLLVPLGPLYGLLARERIGEGGDVVRLILRRL
jgi:hypothetical protein